MTGRLHLTQREYDAMLESQGFKCVTPDCDETEGLIAEHSTPNALRPANPISSCAGPATRSKHCAT